MIRLQKSFLFYFILFSILSNSFLFSKRVLQSYNTLCPVFSVTISPLVSLNFAGGASFVLKPKNYLEYNDPLVSYFTSPFGKILLGL